MASTVPKVSELAAQTARNMTSGPSAWAAYLDTAARMYKYQFSDQLLIHAQRPGATACAELSDWNRKMRRWVKPGSKGVALLVKRGGKWALRYIFDLADTMPGKDAPEPKLWQLREEHTATVLNELERIYGPSDDKNAGIPYRLMDAAEKAVSENYGEACDALLQNRDGSFLEGLDAQNVRVLLRNLLTASVQHMVLTRCGLDPDAYLDADDLRGVYQFNTTPTLARLGNAVSGIAGTILRQIERTVKEYDRKITRSPLAKGKGIGYNEFNNLKRENIEQRSLDNGAAIQAGGGLSSPDTGDRRDGGHAAGPLRDSEGTVSRTKGGRDAGRPAAGGQAASAPDGDRPDGAGARGTVDGGNAESASRPGQGDESDGVGRPHQRPEKNGGGNDTQRANLQLSLFPSAEAQREQIEQEMELEPAEDDKSSAGSIQQAEIDAVLRNGSGIQDGKFRIYEQIQRRQDVKEDAAFFKREFGIGGRSMDFDGTPMWENHDGKGIVLTKGSLLNPDAEIRLTWVKAARRVRDLVALGTYLTSEEQEQYAAWRLTRQADAIEAEQLSRTRASANRSRHQAPTVPPLSNEIPDRGEEYPEPSPLEAISEAPPVNFHIADDDLGAGGPKIKYRNNVAAIRTLKKVEAEKRVATPEEQKILSRYVGWGGVPQAFDINNKDWPYEFIELEGLLTKEEYESARASTLNAHYTSPTIVKAIYGALERMGIQPKNILEPACGTGNFFGLLPESMAASKQYGVELDSITGRIAKQLYPKANIVISGFEHSNFKDGTIDLAVGNVPFGSYSVSDPQYDKHHFHIHDYFFAKTLDKVRPGGVVAFVTSHGTLDKQNPEVRKYIARRADLLGAVRLPMNAFKRNAGTEVTTDIIFLQKREQELDIEPDWVNLGQTSDGVPVNSYFEGHPEMMLGTMQYSKKMYGNENNTACIPVEGAELSEQLAAAMEHIEQPQSLSLDELDNGMTVNEIAIPAADPETRNYSYILQDGKLYYCVNSELTPANTGKAQEERIRGLMELRDITRALIDAQLVEYGDAAIEQLQAKLNRAYDSFTAHHGLINDTANRRAFEDDSSYPLLCSLEDLNDDGTLKQKADMFSKRTIQKHKAATSVDTASEALTVSIQERGCVDLGYMAQLLGGSEHIEKIVRDLRGVIFKDPQTGPFKFDGAWYSGWQTADEYLSGDVREKLQTARAAAEQHPEFAVNVAALEQVQPPDLDASEIDVRMGATWIDPEYYRQFMFALLKTPKNEQGKIFDVLDSPVTGQWTVKGKSIEQKGNLVASSTYGTDRASAYRIMDDILNLRDTRIFDRMETPDGIEKRVLNADATQVAQDKQKQIKEAFRDWIWRDPERRRTLVAHYNATFNATRPREYHGDHLIFAGMNPEIKLLSHQKNAVARILYGGNTLLAHTVGAGKTFEMIAAAMESKRLGLCHKSMFAVPNHMIDQFSRDIYKLYPGAKVLTVTKKDFEKRNRKKFCSRIATGDYDAVVIGHSQFEKIPVSKERQEETFRNQIDEITSEIVLAKAQNQERITIKQLERTKKSLEVKLQRLYDESRKDDTLNFEQLGIDRLFIDEAHLFKNLFTPTKMRNVAGVGTSDAQKATDLYLKCRYLDEVTGGRGVTFATGTPISNSMTELHVMMRYLLHDTLEHANLLHFDSWASSFGETKTDMELAPEGKGFRLKTRFSRFFNLPELIGMFKECADIQTADMLKLPVPEVEYINVKTAPSVYQEDMVDQLSIRADEVRNGNVEPNMDNMLVITNDGRKLALDQRIINPLLPDAPESKVNACIKNVLEVWEDTKTQKSAQLVFCDLSTPKGDGTFNVYDDIRNKLIAQGVPTDEIAFIHEADTDAKKATLFAKVRSGKVRVLLGSTQKMGAGTNIQDNLIALHHLDCPWRPADLEQREGRIVRKGNKNEKVKIYRYVTKGTFDAYSWSIVENKQKFIAQVMTGKSPLRSYEDIDGTALSYAEVKALAAGSPLIKERMELETEVKKLSVLKSSHQRNIHHLEDCLAKSIPQDIQKTREMISGCEADIKHLAAHSPKDPDNFNMNVEGVAFSDKKEAGYAILAACKAFDYRDGPKEIGEYRGFKMTLWLDSLSEQFRITLKHTMSHVAEIGTDIFGNITRLNHTLEAIPKRLEAARDKLDSLETQKAEAQTEVSKPFPQETRLKELEKRLVTVTALLNSEEKVRQEDRERRRMVNTPSVVWRLNQLKELTSVIVSPMPDKPREVTCL